MSREIREIAKEISLYYHPDTIKSVFNLNLLFRFKTIKEYIRVASPMEQAGRLFAGDGGRVNGKAAIKNFLITSKNWKGFYSDILKEELKQILKERH